MNEFCNCEQQEGEFQMTVSPSYMSYEAALVVEKQIESNNFYANRFPLQLASEQWWARQWHHIKLYLL